MKRLKKLNPNSILVAIFCLVFTALGNAQQEFQEEDPGGENQIDKNTATYKRGNGLLFSFNKGNYTFGVTGFIQPGYLSESIKDLDNTRQFRSKRSFFQLEGNALEEKISFFFQLDFSLSNPLMDAWLAYEPFKDFKISFGQKQTFINNREMIYREDRLQFVNRSLLSDLLSRTGREFGVFVESKFKFGSFGVAPMAALTSGDGRNSFGEDSRDADIGGLKLGGRLDLYPFGFFKAGNELTSVDLEREESLKLLLGFAASRNTGASNATGEGHGSFFLYDINGVESLPNYDQVYADILLKYRGFSLLAEYANASASNIEQVYLDENASQILAPQQISQFLSLGDSFNLQTGYLTENGFSFDFRYQSISPEFKDNVNSILQNTNATTLGVSKYFDNNNLKLQASYTMINPSLGNNINQFEVIFQIAF